VSAVVWALAGSVVGCVPFLAAVIAGRYYGPGGRFQRRETARLAAERQAAG
jgi:hypothetical protein